MVGLGSRKALQGPCPGGRTILLQVADKKNFYTLGTSSLNNLLTWNEKERVSLARADPWTYLGKYSVR